MDMGTTGSVAATISNRQPWDYNFEFRERDDGFNPAVQGIFQTAKMPWPVFEGRQSQASSGYQVNSTAEEQKGASGGNPEAACLVAVSAGPSYPAENAQIHATLDELGYAWVDVYTVQEARDAGANVLIDRDADDGRL